MAGITVLFWASAFVVIRPLAGVLSPGGLALGRLAVAAVALTVFALIRRFRIPRGRTLLLLIVYGVLWFGGYMVALNAGEQHLDAGTAALLVNVAPVLITLGAGAFLREGFPRWVIIGSVVSFGGVVVISAGAGDHRIDALGIVFCLTAAILYAAATLLLRVGLRTTQPLQATWIGCLAGMIACLPFAPSLVGELSRASAGVWLGVGYLGLFPTAVAFTTWAYALSVMGAARTGATTYLVPAITIVISWIFLSELPTVYGFIGGAVCLAGVAVTRIRR
ncbi:DMT family transporter [Microlunatus elymi]|uniref:DMT family transporter n=2 Tax=Microlunatus elymi TaxID=2596828 RepID=A0A516Q5C8_9ACTN|nr:DMT family transporter [Microlunatus elymi]